MTQQKSVFRVSPTETVSTGVVRAVATVNGVDPADLDERLYDHIEPDALDSLFRSEKRRSSSEIHVSFTMAGCEVDVFDGQKIVVSPESSRLTARESHR